MRVNFSARHASDDLLQPPVRRVLHHQAVDETLAGEGEHLVAGLLEAVALAVAGGLDVRAVAVESVDERVDALLLGAGGLEDGGLPALARAAEGLVDGAELAVEEIGVREIALVHDEDVGDLHDARLHRLHVVAGPGREDDDGRVGHGGDFDFVLAGADGLDQHHVLAEGVEGGDDAGGRGGEAAEVAARRHAAQKHIGVGGEILHADAVAEEGALRERRRGVDGDDAERAAALSQFAGESAGEGALAGAG